MVKKKLNSTWVRDWVMSAGILVMIGLAAYAVMLAQPMDFKVECSFADWKELPNGSHWVHPISKDELLMYPDRSHCELSGTMSSFIALTVITQEIFD